MHFVVRNISSRLYNLDRPIPAEGALEYSEPQMRAMQPIITRYMGELVVSAVHDGESAAVSPAELVAWAAEG